MKFLCNMYANKKIDVDGGRGVCRRSVEDFSKLEPLIKLKFKHLSSLARLRRADGRGMVEMGGVFNVFSVLPCKHGRLVHYEFIGLVLSCRIYQLRIIYCYYQHKLRQISLAFLRRDSCL